MVWTLVRSLGSDAGLGVVILGGMCFVNCAAGGVVVMLCEYEVLRCVANGSPLISPMSQRESMGLPGNIADRAQAF